MDIWVLSFIVLGILLAAVEVLLPGTIWGSVGGGFLIAAVVLTYKQSGIWMAFGIFAAEIAALSATLGFCIQFFPKFKWAQPFFERAARHGRSVIVLDGEPIIGRQGTTTTALTPSGHIEIDGVDYSAYSKDGRLERGTKIKVVGHKISKLIVEKVAE